MTECHFGSVKRQFITVHFPEELYDCEHGCQGNHYEAEEENVHVHLPEANVTLL